MRIVYGMTVLAVSALALAACGKKDSDKAAPVPGAASEAPAGADDITAPTRKAGLWRQTVTSAGVTQTMRLCTDEATEAKFSVWGGQASKDMCSKQEVKRGLTGDITFTSVCDMGSGGKVTTTGSMKGDFASKYTVTAKSVTEGAGAPQMNGEHDMLMEAVWEGPCPADFRPGDMEVAGGYKFNILDMGAMTGAAQ